MKTFNYEETLIESLHYMATGIPCNKMKEFYGGDWKRYSYELTFFTHIIYYKCRHCSCGRSLDDAVTKVDKFRRAILMCVSFDSDRNQVIDISLER